MRSLSSRDITNQRVPPYVQRTAAAQVLRCGLAVAVTMACGSCLPPAPSHPPSDADNAARSVQLLQKLPGVEQATLTNGARHPIVVVTLRADATEQARAELRTVYEAFFAAPRAQTPPTPAPRLQEGLQQEAIRAVAPTLVFVKAATHERHVWGIPVTDQARGAVMRFVALICSLVGGLALALAWVTRPGRTQRVVTAGHRRARRKSPQSRPRQ